MTDDPRHAQTKRHFGRLARQYDRRWQGYVRRSVDEAVDALRATDPRRILDVGCGTGEFERLAAPRLPEACFVGVDLTPEMLDVARRKFPGTSRATFLLAQAETLPFGAASFDAVVACSMLHHLPEPAALVRECARVLRPGGHLVLVDWCRDFPHGRLAHYWLRLVKPSYVTMYRVRELVALLQAEGLDVREARRFFLPPFFGMVRVSAINIKQKSHTA